MKSGSLSVSGHNAEAIDFAFSFVRDSGSSWNRCSSTACANVPSNADFQEGRVGDQCSEISIVEGIARKSKRLKGITLSAEPSQSVIIGHDHCLSDCYDRKCDSVIYCTLRF